MGHLDQAQGAVNGYGLPSLPAIPCPDMRGPTPWSNWVIRGRVLAGGYPATADDGETARILTTLLELGVDTFVCLQAEFSLHTPEAAWRGGEGLRPYVHDAQRLLIAARQAGSSRILQRKVDFLHLPILDGGVTSDHAVSCLADDCNARILRGERLYVHCWGGHGRTGTLIATMLGRLYSLSCNAALRYTQAMHDSRRFPQGVRSPQTNVQVAQVRRLLPDPASSRGVAYPKPTVLLSDEILRPGVPSSPEVLAGLSITEEDGEEEEGEGEERVKEVASPPQSPQAPANEQRKEAIRARKASPVTGGCLGADCLSAHAHPLMGPPTIDLSARAGPPLAGSPLPDALEEIGAWHLGAALRPSKVTVAVPGCPVGHEAPLKQQPSAPAAASAAALGKARSRVAAMVGRLGGRWPGNSVC